MPNLKKKKILRVFKDVNLKFHSEIDSQKNDGESMPSGVIGELEAEEPGSPRSHDKVKDRMEFRGADNSNALGVPPENMKQSSVFDEIEDEIRHVEMSGFGKDGPGGSSVVPLRMKSSKDEVDIGLPGEAGGVDLRQKSADVVNIDMAANGKVDERPRVSTKIVRIDMNAIEE